ncbi:uncharacterized protein LOC130427529 [Triplophysa dalaica]|uniref:uncharacterized protein LOC130427529 n=1 Tax=Triplophysa dalaica TaxID=1582913 RepID=UPI0024DF8630|nr:uncharacterized protein LOC130427529 [Triplophysa dalaica]
MLIVKLMKYLQAVLSVSQYWCITTSPVCRLSSEESHTTAVLIMKISQTTILHLHLYVFLTLLTHADSDSSVAKIQHHVYTTVYEGHTVTLHCNTTLQNEDITWKMNNTVIFSIDSFYNRNMTNFTSDRMYISPADPTELKINQIQTSDAGNYSCYNTKTSMRWILTVTGYSTENPPESLKQPLLYILISCAGVIMVCLMIGFIICIYRRRSSNRRDIQASRIMSDNRIYEGTTAAEIHDQRGHVIYEICI